MRKLIVGGCLVFIGLFMLLGFFASTKPSTLGVDVMLLLMFVLAPAISGAILIRSHFREKQRTVAMQIKTQRMHQEKEILRLAKEKGGRLTVAEIVAETSIDIDAAEELMREFMIKGMADMKTSDSGLISYEFFDLSENQSPPVTAIPHPPRLME